MNAPAELTGRTARIERKTNETQIVVELNLDGTGHADLATGVPFLDHMLDQVARHSLIDLTVRAQGDLHRVRDVRIGVDHLDVHEPHDEAGEHRQHDRQCDHRATPGTSRASGGHVISVCWWWAVRR